MILNRQDACPSRPWREAVDFDIPRPALPCAGARRDEDTLSVFVCFRLALAPWRLISFLIQLLFISASIQIPVQPRIVGAEMLGKPRLQLLREPLFAEQFPVLVIVHDIADFVEQTLVIRLVRVVTIVVPGAHDLLFQREVRGDARKYLPEKILDRLLAARAHQAVMGLVHQTDQLAVLVIHGRDTDGIFFIPLDKRHRDPPVDGMREQPVAGWSRGGTDPWRATARGM